MTRKNTTIEAIPDWFRETFDVLRSVTGGVREIELKLRATLRMKDLDPRLRSEIENVLDALSVVKVTLSVIDMTTDQVLQQFTGARSPVQ
jgi:hypothetical protein